jgi:flavin reductase (DIM6/NTAB) family NADH-FMN oxidoreductase RutF
MDKDIDPGAFWTLLGMRAIGAAVVTAQGPEGPAGFLALSATHVTAKPPTMLVSVGRRTSALAAVTASGSFAINYLPREREDLARLFGGQGGARGADRFEPGEWTTLATGAPILTGAVGSIDCRIEEAIERHETIIFLGRIVDWVRNDGTEPLISFTGGYR